MLLHPLLAQEHRDLTPRKPWYKRAVEAVGLHLRRPAKRSAPDPARRRLSKCSSLRIAASFTHVCLCAPIASYREAAALQADPAPRRSYSNPKSRASAVPRASLEGRRVIFRGKSLSDDLLMRRFVAEEEAAMREGRRDEMEILRRRVAARRARRAGPSRLSRMSVAGEGPGDLNV